MTNNYKFRIVVAFILLLFFVTLNIRAENHVTIFVQTGMGDPLRRANIFIQQLHEPLYFTRGISDVNGKVEFLGVPSGSYKVVVREGGAPRINTVVEIRNGLENRFLLEQSCNEGKIIVLVLLIAAMITAFFWWLNSKK